MAQKQRTRWTEATDEKSESYQKRTPTASRQIARSIRYGISVALKDMENVLRNWQYLGGFASREEARRWLETPVSNEVITDLRMRASRLSDPERTQVMRQIDSQAYAY